MVQSWHEREYPTECTDDSFGLGRILNQTLIILMNQEKKHEVADWHSE